MNIAVYAIAKNEERHLARWYAACREADHVVLVDTGSTDNTVSAARELGVVVHELKLKEWRFDLARNAALGLVPTGVDWCISLDMDEILSAGWREKLEEAATRFPEATRLQCLLIANAHCENAAKIQFLAERIHRRHGYFWKHPVHEVVAPMPGMRDQKRVVDGFCIEHHPDDEKPRASYLAMLELSVREDPESDRNSHYLGREYFFRGMWRKSIDELARHLGLESARWNEERAASARYIAR